MSALTRFRHASLPAAFAASVAIHVSTFVALVGVDGGPRATARAPQELPSPMLEARLVTLAPAVVPSPEAAVASPPTAAPVPSPPLEIARVDPVVARPAPGAPAGEPSPVGWKPRIVVNDRVPRARFGETLEGDALAAFPIEVDVAIVLPERMEIPYPRDALAARKEGAVLVWAVIDEHGAVAETHVVEGDPEFAEAVESSFARTRFAPARNLGRNIRFYVTLEIEFRLDAGGGTVAVERASAIPR